MKDILTERFSKKEIRITILICSVLLLVILADSFMAVEGASSDRELKPDEGTEELIDDHQGFAMSPYQSGQDYNRVGNVSRRHGSGINFDLLAERLTGIEDHADSMEQDRILQELNRRGIDPLALQALEVVEESDPTYPAEITVNGLTVPLDAVGLTADGDMDVIDHALRLSWYEYGPIPGEFGNALISGHRDWQGEVGTLFKMENYREGDELVIHYHDGSQRTFILQNVSVYPTDEVPKEVMNTRSQFYGERQITLISCAGTFNNGYEDRVLAQFIEQS